MCNVLQTNTVNLTCNVNVSRSKWRVCSHRSQCKTAGQSQFSYRVDIAKNRQANFYDCYTHNAESPRGVVLYLNQVHSSARPSAHVPDHWASICSSPHRPGRTPVQFQCQFTRAGMESLIYWRQVKYGQWALIQDEEYENSLVRVGKHFSIIYV